MAANDIIEAAGLIQLYFSGIELAGRSLLIGDFQKFDAVLGDHNCHITAIFSLAVSQESQLRQEAVAQWIFVKKKKEIQIKTNDPKRPIDLIDRAGCAISFSQKMKYLVCAAILRSGTECIEHRDGTMTLKIDPTCIQGALSKRCSLNLVQRLITHLREYLNARSVAYDQEVAREVLKQKEIDCVKGTFVKVGKTYRNETFQFPCAFYSRIRHKLPKL